MMEEIKLLREKHKLPSASDLKNKVQESLIFMKNNEDKQAHKLAGNNSNVRILHDFDLYTKQQQNVYSSL